MTSPYAAPAHTLPKAAQAILALPGVESLEHEPDGWCCHLAHGWTTAALNGGGTVIDSNLATVRAFVRGAYRLPAAPAPAAPGPKLPAFITHQQQQQQPQQGREYRNPARGGRVEWDEPGESAAALAALPPAPAPCSYDPRRHEFKPGLCFAKAGPAAPAPAPAPAPARVAPGPLARKVAPAHLPAEGGRLLGRFELTLDSILTTGLSNTKIGKGAALAHSAIFHGLPARQLSTAVHGAIDAPVAARGRLEAVRRLALANGLGASVQSLNACPWASAGCRDGCLVFSGRNAMGTAPAACKARRSLARLWAPNVFSVVLLWAIAREYAKAQRLGLPLSLRLKGTDDLPHHLQRFNLSQTEAAILSRRYGLPAIPGWGTTLPEVLQFAMGDGSIRWYEYTKAPLHGSQGMAELQGCGIDVTASLAADRQGGARAATGAIRAGFRLAVPLDVKRGPPSHQNYCWPLRSGCLPPSP
jgi:hypothetical protein